MQFHGLSRCDAKRGEPMKSAKFTLALTLFTVLFFIECTTSVTGGDPGGSEITNGKVVSMAGTPASGITVSAYPPGYIADRWSTATVITTMTDDTGGFTLAIDSGLYNIYIVDSSTECGYFISDIGPKQHLGTLRLDSLGTIQGTIQVDSPNAAQVLVVYSSGTPLKINIPLSSGDFRFDRVPAGSYLLSVAKLPLTGCTPGIDCFPGGTAAPVGIPDVRVASGAITSVDTVLDVNTIGELPRE